jgi:hypothetical protein
VACSNWWQRVSSARWIRTAALSGLLLGAVLFVLAPLLGELPRAKALYHALGMSEPNWWIWPRRIYFFGVVPIFVLLYLDWLRLILRALWVARVSTFSVLLGLLLFGFVPQAQDLFLELKWDPDNPASRVWHLGWAYWTLFYVLAILFWAVPVHFGARLALQTQSSARRIAVDDPAKYKFIVVLLPRALSALCLVAITIGMWQAWDNLHRTFAGQGDPPAILATMTDRLYNRLVASIVVNCALLATFTLLPSLSFFRRLGYWFPNTYAALHSMLGWCCQPTGRWVGTGTQPMRPPYDGFLDFDRHTGILISVSFVLMLFVIFYLAASFIPLDSLRGLLPGALFVPILLGGYVPLLTFLAVLSHRVRLPCILLLTGVIGFITWLTPAWHDLKCARDDKGECIPVEADELQIPIRRAVDAWMEANGCPNKPGECPRPIIVAADGGASRAAFFTGSVLAHLEEMSREPADAKPHDRFANRLFAISAVSGSALGAAVFVGVLEAERKGQKLRPDPWSEDGFLKPWLCNWWGCFSQDKDRQFDPLGIERAVQQVISGDFLTPPVMALMINDLWRFTGISRAAVLEQSWDEQFEKILGADHGKFLRRPLSRAAPDITSPKLAGWRPILVFNGTAVDTGRRIITSTLTGSSGKSDDLFRASHSFYELLCTPASTDSGDKGPANSRCRCNNGTPTCDIGLGTAITNAARFPVITPPGNIKSPPTGLDPNSRDNSTIVQLVVDGGYHEVFGAITAVEIARAISRYKSGLQPYILQITNDPAAFPELCNETLPNATPDVGKFLGIARHPLEAVLNSRTARGYYASAEAALWNRKADPALFDQSRATPRSTDPDSKNSYAHVRVCGKPGTELSMSWWLSMPVQQYLHGQVTENKKRTGECNLACVLNETKRP